MMVLCCGEQLQQALCILQEVMEWSIGDQMVRINVGHLEEQEVSCWVWEVERIVATPSRRSFSPHLTQLSELEPDNSDGPSS